MIEWNELMTEDRKASRNSTANAASTDIDSVYDIGEQTDADLLATLRQVVDNQLPFPDPIPGYRYFWASKSNSYDTVAYRMKLGYRLVLPSEVPGFVPEHTSSQNEVTINEMVLMVIPVSRWLQLMKLHHRTEPDRYDEGIVGDQRVSVENDRNSGFVSFKKRSQAPVFDVNQ
jgi:hypothetical protein